MFVNYRKLAAEPDVALRMLVASATDERILEGLRKGFPEYFTDVKQDVPVPLSMLQAYCSPEDENEGGTLPEEILKHFGVPYFEVFEDARPESWARDLGNSFTLIGAGWTDRPPCIVYVSYKNSRCIVVEHTRLLVILVPEACIDVSC